MAAAARLRVWAPGATETVGAAEAGATQDCVAARVEGSRDRVVRARDGPVQILGGGEPRLHRLDGP